VDWKLIFRLSLLGLAMGVGTVFLIPAKEEFAFWIVIFLLYAYVIAKRCPAKIFLHGLFLGLANSVWITAMHISMFNLYIANHEKEAAMMASLPLPDSPRLMMAVVGPVVGLVSGVIIGVMALVASRLLKSPRQISA
jgi:hypothetical protein